MKRCGMVPRRIQSRRSRVKGRRRARTCDVWLIMIRCEVALSRGAWGAHR